MDLNKTQRQRIVREIVNCEEQVEETPEEYDTELNNMSDEELKSEWIGVVGHWILSRGDVEVENLDSMFMKVVKDGERPYGFV